MEQRSPLYSPEQERDACGVGFVADISGKRDYRILDMALECVTNLTHRGALDAEARFYLMSRGLGPIQAERLVVLGFLGEVLSKLPLAGVVQKVTRVIEEKLAQQG
ncbi:MAG: SufD family Fe-S cluster assembly protein [Chloroflexi bacterium]|nr:SufD family Fe-S cluster assembly protein [Chloroflexota bacterium]